MVVTNPGFEDKLASWKIDSVAGKGDQFAPVDEVAEVVSTHAFQGESSLRLGVKSDNQGNCQGGARRARQFIIPNGGTPFSAPSRHITIWTSGHEWSTPSRFNFMNRLYFSNGSMDPLNPDEVVNLFRRHWRSSNDFDNRVETRTGSDGNTWSRYTVEVPTGIDTNNMSVAFVNWYDTWDCHRGWGRVSVDSFQFTDPDGTPLPEPAPDISISSVNVPESVFVGEPITIGVEVVNQGDAAGAEDIEVTVNDTGIGSQKVRVPAGESTTMEVTWVPTTEKEVQICAHLLKDTLGDKVCTAVQIQPSPCALDIPILGEIDCNTATLGGLGLLGVGAVGITLLEMD